MLALTRALGIAIGVVLAACEASGPPPIPGDWRDRVVYQIVVDRFANGDPSNDDAGGVGPVPGDLSRWQGGDWRGITEHLDHLVALGVSAIWISPIHRSVARMEVADGYHGYWTADYTSLEPHFGDEDDLHALVDGAHARDIAVIVDVVPNHTGRVFSYDLDGDGVVGDGEALAPYRDTPYDVPLLFTETPRLVSPSGVGFVLGREHFHRRGVGDLAIDVERRWGDFPDGLRDLATEDETVADALAATYVLWAQRFDLDGFRVDAVPHAEMVFWRRFCAAVRAGARAAGHERFFLLGEIYETDPARLAPWLAEGSVDAGFDFPATRDLLTGVVLGGLPPAGARARLEDDRAVYPSAPQPGGIGVDPWHARVLAADSHDLPRVRSLVDDPFAVDQAMVVVFTAGGIPLVYYGTEAELAGPGGHLGRERLWDVGFDATTPTFPLLALLSSIRDGSRALRRGETHVLHASETGGNALDTAVADAGLLVYERVMDAERVIVVVATHPTHRARATITTELAPGATLQDVLGGEVRLAVGEGGTIDVDVGPRTSWILVAE